MPTGEADIVLGNRRAGFTVAEVVIGSAIMLVVGLAVLSTMSYGRRTSSLTENRLASLHYARQVLESLCTVSYSSTNLTAGTVQLPGNKGSYVVTEASDGMTKDVTVVVRWVEPLGMTQSVSLATSISRSLHK